MRQAARKNITLLSRADRAHLEAYARGVNAFINSHRDRLPIEFRILGYSPQPWSVEDSMLMGAYMVEDLTTFPRHAIMREKILAKLGADLTADLYVNSSWRDRPPTVIRQTIDRANPDQDEDDDEDDDSGMDSAVTKLTGISHGNRIFNEPSRAPAQTQRTQRNTEEAGGALDIAPSTSEFFDDPPLVLGSNNWVVSGAHTVSGKPLLSNDMHLGHQMPNLWYEAHLRCDRCDGFDVAGVTLPGYPYVIVGHNPRSRVGIHQRRPDHRRYLR